jgi:membrane-associated protein
MSWLVQAYEMYRGLFNPEFLQQMLTQWGWVAYIVLFSIIFAETGLLIGFCLPGDSLLFVAGFFCATSNGGLSIAILIPLLIVAAVVGDTTGYWLGYRAGPLVFRKENSLFFNKKHLISAHEFYEKYGGPTIIYARFIPIIRTFAPFVAGVGKMNYRRFLSYNVWGGIGWIVIISLLGYYLGSIPFVKKHLEKFVVLVVVISFMPIVIEYWRSRRKKAAGTPTNNNPGMAREAGAPE